LKTIGNEMYIFALYVFSIIHHSTFKIHLFDISTC